MEGGGRAEASGACLYRGLAWWVRAPSSLSEGEKLAEEYVLAWRVVNIGQ